MHSRLLIFFWRRKFLFFGSSALFMVAIWLWGFLYTTSSNNEGKVISIKDYMMNGKNYGILQKMGFHENKGINEANDDPIRFLKPTSLGSYAAQRKG